MKKFVFISVLTFLILLEIFSLFNFQENAKGYQKHDTKSIIKTNNKIINHKILDNHSRRLANDILHYLRTTHKNINIYVLNHQNEILNETISNDTILPSNYLNYHNMFLIGSCNKFITGIIIKQLEIEGKLNTNIPVKTIIPNFKYGEIKIKDIILHRSGLAYYNPPEKGYGLDDSVQSINKAGIDVKAKGNFFYNDANYILLAKIIENITHKSYETNVNERIINRYDLEETAFFDNKNKFKKFVSGYDFKYKRLYKNNDEGLDKFYGAGNIFMSTGDLAKFANLFITNKIFDEKTTDSLLNNISIDTLQKYRYGFYKENGYYRTRGYMLGQDIVCYFNKETTIVLATNHIKYDDTKTNEQDAKMILKIINQFNLQQNI